VVDGMMLLQEREQCEKNLYFKEWIKRIVEEVLIARDTVSNGVSLDFPMIKFYQGKKAGLDRVFQIPDEIIEDASKEEN